IPPALTSPEKWTIPASVDRASLTPYSEEQREAYEAKVVATYKQLFAEWTTVFVRNNLPDELREAYAADFRAGRLALFHTSSEAEPRAVGVERQYSAFLDFCRTGQTIAYAEPWASAWGEHGGQADDRWCSPAQWNYWTMLLNLHCGVSFIG